jgi:hypothetical protein
MNAKLSNQPLTKWDDEGPKKRRKAGQKLPLKETIELSEPRNTGYLT